MLWWREIPSESNWLVGGSECGFLSLVLFVNFFCLPTLSDRLFLIRVSYLLGKKLKGSLESLGGWCGLKPSVQNKRSRNQDLGLFADGAGLGMKGGRKKIWGGRMLGAMVQDRSLWSSLLSSQGVEHHQINVRVSSRLLLDYWLIGQLSEWFLALIPRLTQPDRSLSFFNHGLFAF